jgi:hypothetical protein
VKYQEFPVTREDLIAALPSEQNLDAFLPHSLENLVLPYSARRRERPLLDAEVFNYGIGSPRAKRPAESLLTGSDTLTTSGTLPRC